MSSVSHPFQQDLDTVRSHYTALLERHGDSPQTAQWADLETQERRMQILAEVGDLSRAKILDFGCGTGHLLTYLQQNLDFCGEYVGYDLSTKIIDAARQKHPAGRFEARDVLTDGVGELFDYVLISGVFNNKVADNVGLTQALLRALFPACRQALAFNALSTFVEFFDPQLSYLSPLETFCFCKEQLSPLVTLRHDYQLRSGVVPYEFTCYVRCGDVAPVSQRTD